MSVRMLSGEAIRTLAIEVVARQCQPYALAERHPRPEDAAMAVARLLRAENRDSASVLYAPRVVAEMEEAAGAIAPITSAHVHMRQPMQTGRLARLVAAYDAQASDARDYASSTARAIVEAMRADLCRSLPGYEAAAGEW